MPSRVSSFVALIPVLALCAGAGVVVSQEAAEPEKASSPMVKRLMERDTNADGLLTQEELGEGRGQRLFEFADTNEDGMLARDELEKFFASRRGGGQPRSAQASESKEISGEKIFHDSMEEAGEVLRKLKRSSFTEQTRPSDLARIQQIQEQLLIAKAAYMDAPVSDRAATEFGHDQQALRISLRMDIARALKGTLEIELAILEGDTQAAMREIEKLQDLRDQSHDLFEPEEEEED